MKYYPLIDTLILIASSPVVQLFVVQHRSAITTRKLWQKTTTQLYATPDNPLSSLGLLLRLLLLSTVFLHITFKFELVFSTWSLSVVETYKSVATSLGASFFVRKRNGQKAVPQID